MKQRDVLERAKETLRTAELGLADLRSGPPDRRIAGLCNAVVFGRAVTNVLENLRSCEPTFDAWYKTRSEALASDDEMKFLYKLRSEILKQGRVPVARAFHARHLRMPLDPERFPAPPGATACFIDSFGPGWLIPLPDGTQEKYYAQLPSDVGVSTTLLLRSADMAADATDLVGRYLKRMRELVSEAEERFGGAG